MKHAPAIVISIVITVVFVYFLNRAEPYNPGLVMPQPANNGPGDVTLYIGDGANGCAFLDLGGDVVLETSADTLLLFWGDRISFVNTYNTPVTVEFASSNFAETKTLPVGPRSRVTTKIVGNHGFITDLTLTGCPGDQSTPKVRVGDDP
jgi:hypothetical protein